MGPGRKSKCEANVENAMSSNVKISLKANIFENRLPVPEHRNQQQQTCIVPEAGGNATRQWGRVGCMLADHRDGLSSSRFLSWSSIAQSVCQWAFSLLDIRFQRPWVRILHSAEEDNLSPFDSKIACLCRSIAISHNKHVCMYACIYVRTYVRMYVYRQSQVPKA